MSQIEILPNSLTSTPKVDFNLSRNGQTWLYLFCANCGADGGRVLETDVPNAEQFAFYLCNPCAEKHGNIPGTMMVPDEIILQKIREAQFEEYGRLLTGEEIYSELQDESSPMSKLKKET